MSQLTYSDNYIILNKCIVDANVRRRRINKPADINTVKSFVLERNIEYLYVLYTQFILHFLLCLH